MREDKFIQLDIRCSVEQAEILIAELAELGFDSFEETEAGLIASIETAAFQDEEVNLLIVRYGIMGKINYTATEVERQNWNEDWEKNYEPIAVMDQCYIRATFHASAKTFPYEIVINPKMSFGTGHHATTWLMVKQQLDLSHEGRRVLDIGCGTGILAIMAGLRGAAAIEAFDIDDWAVENARENFALNAVVADRLKKGTIETVNPQGKFDIVLANINRNVLLDELHQYEPLITPGGHLLLSGFYEEDIPAIDELCRKLKLQLLRSETKDQWAVLVYIKS